MSDNTTREPLDTASGCDEWEFWEDDADDYCPMCGGDGVVMLSDCGPSEWGEDCFCEEDRLVACPECRERERYESLRKQIEAGLNRELNHGDKGGVR